MRLRLLQEHFYLFQLGSGVVFLTIAWTFFRPKRPESGFRVREADRDIKFTSKGNTDLGNAKLKSDPLRLSGIRLDGRPHEILGIKASATTEEIQKAYRDLMKQYHPDKVGRPGTREWQDAQKIAETLNRAKAEMLRSR